MMESSVFLSSLGLLLGSLIWFCLYMRQNSNKKEIKSKLRIRKERKQAYRNKQFNELRSTYKLDAKSKEILKLDWTTLTENLQSRKLTARQVLTAYTIKALEATEFSNAVTEFNPKAFEIAKKLDKMVEVKGPLHGVPFCVKDDTNVAGMDSTIGLAKYCFQPLSKSAPLVLALEELGAIPFCKTNVAQTLFSFGGDNPVFGETTSCHSQKLGPGGSSSGTGALVGAGAAFFGTGTDIGGSVRVPAHCNGVAGIKPTPGRLSVNGCTSSLPNIVGLQGTPGIIGQDASIVSSVCKLLLQNNLQKQFDPQVCPIPWNETLFSSNSKRLRIGYFVQQNFVPPIGDTVDTVYRAVAALESVGHTLVPFEIPKIETFMGIGFKYLFGDENEDVFRECWSGEEIAKCMKPVELVGRTPSWLLKLVTILMRQKSILPFMYSPRMATLIEPVITARKVALRHNRSDHVKITQELIDGWTRLKIDACICPVSPYPAPPFPAPSQKSFLKFDNYFRMDMQYVGTVYCCPWNVANFPAGVVTFGVESGKNIEKYDCQGDQLLEMCKKGCKKSVGAPIGVQVVTLPFQEEMLLGLMEDLENWRIKNNIN